MKMGFITNSFVQEGVKDLDAIARWAVHNGFTDLEVGPTVPLVAEDFLKAKEAYGINISTLIYCRNFLMPDTGQAGLLLEGLKERIVFAGNIGAKQVVTTTGISEKSFEGGDYRPDRSLKLFQETFEPVIELAEQNKVDILLEVCPLMGNIAVSPYMWDMIFSSVKSERLGIAYDPSHLVWQFIDPYGPITEYAGKIRHVHGKDCELNHNMIKRTGARHMFGMAVNEKDGWIHKDAGLTEAEADMKERHSMKEGHSMKEEHSMKERYSMKERHSMEENSNLWWRYRLPGLGELDWNRIVSRLYEAGFDGTISIEHEDPVWSGGLDKVKQGVITAREHIAQFL